MYIVFQSLGRDSVGLGYIPNISICPGDIKFQSLGRDSVGLGDMLDGATAGTWDVSIPRSGFCGVRQLAL